jgi:hypothetical protein
MTTPEPVKPTSRRTWTGRSQRRVSAQARAVQELAAAERALLEARQDTARFEDTRRAMSTSDTNNAAENKHQPKRWPIAKIIGAVVISLLVLAGTLIMAAVAIGMQIGFFTERLPESVQTVQLPILHVQLRIPSYAPISLEAGAWLLTLMVLMLVMCRLRYGRWHRSMLYIASSVAIINGWHTGRITNDLSTGIAFGALSILGPWIVHLYVQFLRQLVAGDTVTEAMAETGNRLIAVIRAAIQIVVMVLRYAVLGLLFHPIRSIKLLRAWADPANITPNEERLGRAWRAEILEHDERLRARMLGLRERVETNVTPQRRSLRGFLAVLFDRGNTAHALGESQGTGQQSSVPRGGHGPAVSQRPETPLPGSGDKQWPGGVLTAVRDPDESANDSTNANRSQRSSEQPSVRDDPEGDRSGVRGAFDERSYLAELGDDEHLLTEVNTLIEQLGPNSANGCERPSENVRAAFTDRGNVDEHATIDDRSPAPTSSDKDEQSNGNQPKTTVRAAGDLPVALGPQALIVRHYWLLVDRGDNVQDKSRAQIARDLGLKQGTVRRTWNECLCGQHPRPRPPATNDPANHAND